MYDFQLVRHCNYSHRLRVISTFNNIATLSSVYNVTMAFILTKNNNNLEIWFRG